MMMQAMAVNSRPNSSVIGCSSNQPAGASACSICAATPDRSSTKAENLKPMPVSVVMPRTKPTQAQAAPMPSADLAPISKPCTRARGVMARPVMLRPIEPNGLSSLGIHEQATVSVMPQNADGGLLVDPQAGHRQRDAPERSQEGRV